MADRTYFDASRRWWERSRRARGSLDLVEFTGDTASVAGWLLRPDQPIDRVAVYLDEHLLGEQVVVHREDLAQLFGHVPHGGLSGFGIAGEFRTAGKDFVSVSVVGLPRDGERFVLQRYCLTSPEPLDRLPPAHLRQRVAGTDDPKLFTDSGADNALQFIGSLHKHLNARAAPCVLDWGCGAGRMARYLLRFWPEATLTGCDIDAEAVGWCERKLRPGTFRATAPFPPLPFEDGSFDAVIGYSVMTHLSWPLQERWLSEIRRVLVPGGVFATSVHGSFAANLTPGLPDRLERAGILDETLDPALDGVAPRGYYRAVFQTPAFTRERWGREFEVVDYIEGGLSALHDLVELRRPAGP
jgi:SAM-dependent methyltransferase